MGGVGTETFYEIGTMVDAGMVTEVGSGVTVEAAVVVLLALIY